MWSTDRDCGMILNALVCRYAFGSKIIFRFGRSLQRWPVWVPLKLGLYEGMQIINTIHNFIIHIAVNVLILVGRSIHFAICHYVQLIWVWSLVQSHYCYQYLNLSHFSMLWRCWMHLLWRVKYFSWVNMFNLLVYDLQLVLAHYNKVMYSASRITTITIFQQSVNQKWKNSPSHGH